MLKGQDRAFRLEMLLQAKKELNILLNYLTGTPLNAEQSRTVLSNGNLKLQVTWKQILKWINHKL